MNQSNLPATFIENSVAKLQQIDMMRVPADVPIEMRDNSIEPNDDWIGWKIIPSTVTNQHLNDLEERLGLVYPPIYRQFLQSYHFYELWYLRFQEHLIHSWQDDLIQLYEGCSNLIEHGLIPFGTEPTTDGIACFDTTARLKNGDCPVVFWDHEWIGTEQEINPLFSSGEAMFRCLNFLLEAPIEFLCHDEAVSPGALPLKKKLMAEFLALDAEGAGGSARDYWTFTVKP